MKPSLLTAPRSTPRDSVRWMRWDLPFRIVPLLGLPLLLATLGALSFQALGLTTQGLALQAALGLPLGLAMACLAWWYRWRVVGRVVVPTGQDAWLQSFYYVLLNTPAEELFFRGLLLGGMAPLIGTWPAWLLSTLVFGLYHIPAGWGWRAVGGVTAAGGLFGWLFLLGAGSGSLVLPSIVHAFATCAFLSAGPWLASALELRRSTPLTASSTHAHAPRAE